jgi:hypothetical protein
MLDRNHQIRLIGKVFSSSSTSEMNLSSVTDAITCVPLQVPEGTRTATETKSDNLCLMGNRT